MLPSIILLEDDWVFNLMKKLEVLLPSIILLEDDHQVKESQLILVLLPSIILLEDDPVAEGYSRGLCFATIYYFARR